MGSPEGPSLAGVVQLQRQTSVLPRGRFEMQAPLRDWVTWPEARDAWAPGAGRGRKDPPPPGTSGGGRPCAPWISALGPGQCRTSLCHEPQRVVTCCGRPRTPTPSWHQTPLSEIRPCLHVEKQHMSAGESAWARWCFMMQSLLWPQEGASTKENETVAGHPTRRLTCMKGRLAHAHAHTHTGRSMSASLT